MADSPELVSYMQICAERLRDHHDTLWEEEKHYSWWVYIVLAGLIFVYSSSGIEVAPKLAIIVVGCLFGMWLCVSGLRVIHLESEYFYEARELFNRTALALDLGKQHVKLPEGRLLVVQTDSKDMADVRRDANRPDWGIRSLFKYNLVATLLLFSSFIVFSVFTLLCLR